MSAVAGPPAPVTAGQLVNRHPMKTARTVFFIAGQTSPAFSEMEKGKLTIRFLIRNRQEVYNSTSELF